MSPAEPSVVILCGGRGTRLQEHTQSIPKPLVEIGGRPIVWHVIQIYAAQGFRRFLLCTGYKGELIEQFVARRAVAGRRRRRRASTPALDTPTGGRVLAAARAARRRGRSAPPTPTASPTSTCTRCSPPTARTATSRR